VKKPGSYPYLKGLNLHQVLAQAGGITNNANLGSFTISRRDKTGEVEVMLKGRSEEVLEVELKGIVLQEGDVITVPKKVVSSIMVQSEGEFLRPGTYQLPKGSRISDLVRISGGYTGSAFTTGAGFFRGSVAEVYNRQMLKLADQIEEGLIRQQNKTIEASLESQESKNAAIFAKQERLVMRLRETKSAGRVGLDMDMPLEQFIGTSNDLLLEDGDRLNIPSEPSTVNVLGQVYNPSTLAWQPDLSTKDYLDAAGGVTKSADKDNIYVLRANGRVVPLKNIQKRGSWITGRETSELALKIGPGDTVLVPEDFEIKTNRLQLTKDVTQIMFQIIASLGVVVAAF